MTKLRSLPLAVKVAILCGVAAAMLAAGLLAGGGTRHATGDRPVGTLDAFAAVIDHIDTQPGVRALADAPDVTMLSGAQVDEFAAECAQAQTALAGYRWPRADRQVQAVIDGFGNVAQAVRTQDDSFLGPAGRSLNAAIETAGAVLMAP